MKRTQLSEFSNPRAGGVIAAGVKGDDQIFDVLLSDGKAEVLEEVPIPTGTLDPLLGRVDCSGRQAWVLVSSRTRR